MGILQRQVVSVPAGFSQNAPPGNGLATNHVLETGLSSLSREAQIAYRQVIVEELQRIQFCDLREARARFLSENPAPQELPEARHQRFLRDDTQYLALARQLEARGVELHEKEVNDRVHFNPAFRTLTAQLRQQLATLTEQRDALDALTNTGRSTDSTSSSVGASTSVQLLAQTSEQASEHANGASSKESPLPGRKRGSLASRLVTGALIAGAGLGLTQFGRHIAKTSEIITAPEEEPDSGNPVRDQITDFWLPQATETLIKECLDAKTLESVETMQAYLKQGRQQELWLALTRESQDKFGRIVRTSYVLYPSRIDDRWFSAFKAVVSQILESPTSDSTTGMDFWPTRISVLSPEKTEGRNPLDVIRDLTISSRNMPDRQVNKSTGYSLTVPSRHQRRVSGHALAAGPMTSSAGLGPRMSYSRE